MKLLCFLCGSSPAAETRDLLLIGNQSNAVGYYPTTVRPAAG